MFNPVSQECGGMVSELNMTQYRWRNGTQHSQDFVGFRYRSTQPTILLTEPYWNMTHYLCCLFKGIPENKLFNGSEQI